MSWLIEIISETIFLPIRCIYSYMVKRKALTATKLLIEKANLECLTNPISDIGGTYWLIAVHFGKANTIYSWFLSKEKELKTSVRLRFEADDGSKFYSDSYQVNKGWGRKSDTFLIRPELTVKLAIVRRSLNDLCLYPLSGSFAKDPLEKTYHLQLIFHLEPEQKELIYPQFKVPFYIKDGQINEV